MPRAVNPLSGLLLSIALAACASSGPNVATKAPLPRATPVDPRLESPSLVWRTAPPPHQGARRAVREFFDAVAHEAGPQLETLFAEEALFHRPNQPATPAVLAWLRRLSASDYTRHVLPADVPVQLLDRSSSLRLAAHRAVHIQPQSGEYLAVVGLHSVQAQAPALWGSELQLVLTFREGQWQIRELWEDYVPR